MNKQSRDGIGYVDATWNPVTGCMRGCGYCFAQRLAHRFDAGLKECDSSHDPPVSVTRHDLASPIHMRDRRGIWRPQPFPFGFEPTLHRYRLDEPARRRKPARIFVCDMADLFGEWVPREWEDAVFDAAAAANWHTYCWLSKDPDLMTAAWERWKYDHEDTYYLQRWWFGTTVTSQDDILRIDVLPDDDPGVFGRWVSFEPLLGPIDLDPIQLAIIDFAVIGGLTGAKPPGDTQRWAGRLIEQLSVEQIPFWVKGDLYERFPFRMLPRGLGVSA